MKFDKYKKNLRYEYPFVYSYDTRVAEVIDNKYLFELKYYSVTTSKYVRYAANELNLKLLRYNESIVFE